MARRARVARAHMLVQVKRLGDLLFDGVERIERGHRLLEHHRDAVAADAAQHRLRRAHQLLPVELDAARRPMRRGGVGQELQHRQRRHRFSRPRFADERQGLALVEIERDAAHRLDNAARRVERHGEIADGEESHQRSAISCQLFRRAISAVSMRFTPALAGDAFVDGALRKFRSRPEEKIFELACGTHCHVKERAIGIAARPHPSAILAEWTTLPAASADVSRNARSLEKRRSA